MNTTLKPWFFAHGGSSADGHPSTPCCHQHRRREDAVRCARRKYLAHVREVDKDGHAIADHDVDLEHCIPGCNP